MQTEIDSRSLLEAMQQISRSSAPRAVIDLLSIHEYSSTRKEGASMSTTEPDQKESFYQEAEAKHLIPLWKVTAKLLPPQPQTKVLPYLWKWSDLRRMAYRAGELVPIERG